MRKKEDDESSHESDVGSAEYDRIDEIDDVRLPTQKKIPPLIKKTPQKRKPPAEEMNNEGNDESQISSGGGGRTKRRFAQCAVDGCHINENSAKSPGKKYSLFDPPKDKAGRLRWSLYVPGVDCAVHLLRYCKVCELHFVDGEPTKENPLPTQNLHPSEDFGFNKNDHEPKKNVKKIETKEKLEAKLEIKSEEDEETDETKQTLKIKFPTQKTKKIEEKPPAKKQKLWPPDSQAVEPVNKMGSSAPKIASSQTSTPLSVNSIMKEAFNVSKPGLNNSNRTTTPAAVRQSAPAVKMSASIVAKQAPTMVVQGFSKLATANFGQKVVAAPRPPSHSNEYNFSASRPQLETSVSNNEDERHLLEPCQHCGLELVEIRKDLVRMENKIDMVSTLLRSVLQRTLPTPRSASIVKISPTTTVTANIQPNGEKDEQSAKADVVVRKNVVGKPMKFIISADGKIAHGEMPPHPSSFESRAESSAMPTMVAAEPRTTTMFPPNVKLRSINSAAANASVQSSVAKNVNNSSPKTSPIKGIRKVSANESRTEDDDDYDDDLSMESGEVPMHNKKSSTDAVTVKESPSKTARISVVPKRSPNEDPADDEMNESPSKNDPSFGEETEMNQAVARTALLFTGRGLTINHLKEYGPTWLSGIAQDEIQGVLDTLVIEGMLEGIGEHQVNWPNTSSKSSLTMEVYRKLPPDEIEDDKLSSYGVTRRSYLASYKQKSSKFTSQLNKLCEDDD